MKSRTLVTSSVAEKMKESSSFHAFVISSITRHLMGDWGECYKEDAMTNDVDPLNAMSVYTYFDGSTIWIKSDYDIITVLFPSEY